MLFKDIIISSSYVKHSSEIWVFPVCMYLSLLVELESFSLEAQTLGLVSGSCHLDRASNVEIGVEYQIFVIVIFFNKVH